MKEVLVIYNSDGTKFAPGGMAYPEGGVALEEYSFTSERMGTSSLTATVRHPLCLDSFWKGGEYVDFRGDRFILKATPSSSKDNTDARYTHSLSFMSLRDAILGNIYFVDAVASGAASSSSYQSQSTDVYFSGTLQEFLSRVQDVVENRGLDYSFACDSSVGATEKKMVTFSAKTVFEVLQEAYGLWEVPFYFKGTQCFFGTGADYTPSQVLSYGASNQLLSISKNNQDSALITRITGHGSDENVPYYYPNATPQGDVTLVTGGGLDRSKVTVHNIVKLAEKLSSSETMTCVESYYSLSLSNPSLYDDIMGTSLNGGTRYNNTATDASGKVTAEKASAGYASYTPQEWPTDLTYRTAYLCEKDGDIAFHLQWALGNVTLNSQSRYGFPSPNPFENIKFYKTNSTELVYEWSGSLKDYFQVGTPKMRVSRDGNVMATVNASDPVMATKHMPWAKYNGTRTDFMYSEPYLLFADFQSCEDQTFHFPGVSLEKGVTYSVEVFIPFRQYIPFYSFGFASWFNRKEKMWYNTGSESMSKDFEVRADVTFSMLFRDNAEHLAWKKGSTVIRNSQLKDKMGIEIPDSAISVGNTISYTASNRVPYSGHLLPSIWRQSGFLNRWLNAKNSTYDGYTFAHEYDPSFPKEYIKDFEDIKPTITEMKNASGQNINVVSEVYYETGYDPVVMEEDGTTRRFSRFFVKLRKTDGSNSFNLFESAIDEGAMTFVMTSGKCGSCQFELQVDEYGRNPVQTDEQGYLLNTEGKRCVDYGGKVAVSGKILARQNNTSSNEVWICLSLDESTYGGGSNDEAIMPSRLFRVLSGDTFVISHIMLPDAVLRNAEDRLQKALLDYMLDNNADKWSFTVKMSRIWLEENPSVMNNLDEHSSVRLSYNGVQLPLLYVTSYTYKATSDPLPEISVDLKDVVSVNDSGITRKIKSAINDTMKVAEFSGYIGGSSSLGGATNVDPGADAITEEDQILVREANTSLWRSRNIADVLGVSRATVVKMSAGVVSPSVNVSGVVGDGGLDRYLGELSSESAEVDDTADPGSYYVVTEAGTYAGKKALVGDLMVRRATTGETAEWAIFMADRKAPDEGITVGSAQLSYGDETLKSSKNFCSFGEITAFGVGEETPGSGESLGTLENVNESADGTATSDTVLVKLSDSDEWTTAPLSDILKMGTLKSATISSTDGEGHTGSFVKMVFTTGQTAYINLNATATNVVVTPNYTTGDTVATITVDGVAKTIKVPSVNVPVTSVVGQTGAITADQIKSAINLSDYMLSSGFTTESVKTVLGIYNWALAATKPSYTFSEIGAKPTTLSGYGITDAFTKTEIRNMIGEGTVTIGTTTIKLGEAAETITFANGKFIKWKKNDGTAVDVLGLNSDNQLGINFPMMFNGEKVYFGSASHYIEWTGERFRFSDPVLSENEVSAFGADEENPNSGVSLGTLGNVSLDADDTPTSNQILVRYSSGEEWQPVAFNDMFATGTLTSASLSSTDGSGKSGTFLKMVFNTGDIVYADLSAMSNATMTRLFEKIEELESRIVCLPEDQLLEMYNAGTLDVNKVYYGYEEE